MKYQQESPTTMPLIVLTAYYFPPKNPHIGCSNATKNIVPSPRFDEYTTVRRIHDQFEPLHKLLVQDLLQNEMEGKFGLAEARAYLDNVKNHVSVEVDESRKRSKNLF